LRLLHTRLRYRQGENNLMAAKKYYYWLGLMVMAVAIWSCNKNDLVDTTATNSNLNVINAVTDIRAIDIYLNGTRQNVNSAIYLYNASGYLGLTTGEQQYQFKSDTDRTVLIDTKLNLATKDSSYTVVLNGQQNKSTINAIFIADHFPKAVTGKAMVRFVQASPGTSSYDVFVGDTLSFKNNAYKAVTTFQSVNPGIKTVRVNAAGAGTNIVSGPFTLLAGSYYTFYTTGVVGGNLNNAFTIASNLSK
jgi:hypothetical protein